MDRRDLSDRLRDIISGYQRSFATKSYAPENSEHDVLMDVFGITPDIKRENRQYWGRELGMCWQTIVSSVFQFTREDFQPALQANGEEPCDFMFGDFSVDTKYRIGSGDSATLRKFRQNGLALTELGYTPVILALRTDNLPAAVAACKAGSWQFLTAQDSFDFVQRHTGFDLAQYLTGIGGEFQLAR